MTYLLDTNAWIRLFRFPEKIRADVRRILAGERLFGLSTFSLIEVAQKNAEAPELLGLSVGIDVWFDFAVPESRIRLLPVTPRIAAKAYDLGDDFHGDPADRIIVATGIIHNLTLVTSDKQLLKCKLIQSLSTV